MLYNNRLRCLMSCLKLKNICFGDLNPGHILSWLLSLAMRTGTSFGALVLENVLADPLMANFNTAAYIEPTRYTLRAALVS